MSTLVKMPTLSSVGRIILVILFSSAFLIVKQIS
uniref:Uncharacterized protein n=1 Tax=Anguilla anguilla TaxID=7936 RepID=A0A0E9QSV9_ANGAN